MLRSITIDDVVGENEPDQKYLVPDRVLDISRLLSLVSLVDCCISAALPDDIDRLEHLQFVRIQDAVRRIEKLLMIDIIESDLYLTVWSTVSRAFMYSCSRNSRNEALMYWNRVLQTVILLRTVI